MQLIELNMRNFRKHIDRKVMFTEGLNIVRAENEGGKSTMYEAIAYALGGSRSLSTSLEQAVTWGEDPKTLRVSLQVESVGVRYTINRSAAGAEVLRGADVFCTGQTEVTNWVAQNLVQADAKMASKLMFSSQGNLRGALDAGPTALAEMIEALADMSIFDQILDAAQNKWTLGPTQALEQQLAIACESLEGTEVARAGMGSLDVEDHERKLGQLAEAQDDLAKQAGKVHAQVEEAQQGLTALVNRRRAREEGAAKYREKQQVLVQLSSQLKLLEKEAAVTPPDVAALETQLSEAEEYEQLVKTWSTFSLIKPLDFTFDGTEEQFEQLRESAGVELQRVNNEIAALLARRQLVLKDRINHTTCDKCGQDVSHLKQVQETNARVDGEVAQIDGKHSALLARRPTLEERVQYYQRLAKQVREFRGQVSPIVNSKWVVISDTFPPVLRWIGPEVSAEAPDVGSLRRALNVAKDQVKKINEAQGKVSLLTEQVADQSAEVDQLLKAFQNIEEVYDTELDAAQQVVDTLAQREAELLREALSYGSQIEVEKAEFRRIQDQIAIFDTMIERSKKHVDDLEASIELQQFRNGLVKKVKALRPMVANKLWNTLLTGASVMYSQLRGEDSIITKEKEGFLVNGKPVEAYSGSAKDMLGLALRCALVRTFLPNCALLALDEPGQGCSKARTEVMLGFLSSTGFKQTLLVTHDDLAEQVASNLIQF